MRFVLFSFFFWFVFDFSKNTIFLSIGLQKGRPVQEKPSAPKKEKKEIENFFSIFFYFCCSILPSGIRIRTWIPISGSWSTDLIESRSNPKTEHCTILSGVPVDDMARTISDGCKTLRQQWRIFLVAGGINNRKGVEEREYPQPQVSLIHCTSLDMRILQQNIWK